MTDEETRRRNNRIAYLNDIGWALVQGPCALYPELELDDFGWLDLELRLSWWQPRNRAWESVTIYTDSNFLMPVMRHARYSKVVRHSERSLDDLPHWPNVEVRLTYFETQRAWVNEQIYALHGAIAHLPFVPYGLATERDGPKIPSDLSRGRIGIYVRNWNQITEFVSKAGPVGDPLSDLFFTIFEGLREINEPFDRQKWREVYDRDPRQQEESWEWDGEPQPQIEHLAVTTNTPAL